MTPMAERVLKELQRERGEPVRAGMIAARLNCSRRAVYNYLMELYAKNLVLRPSPRRWLVTGELRGNLV